MNFLKLIQTGSVRPTCGEDGIHDSLKYFICETEVRAIIRPNQPLERQFAFVQLDVALALGYKSPKDAGESMRLINGEDYDSEKIRVIYQAGKRDGLEKIQTVSSRATTMRVLTWKGLTKFLARSNHERAQQFLDVLAQKSSDLAFYGIAFADKSAVAGLTEMSEAVNRIERLEAEVAELKAAHGRNSQAAQIFGLFQQMTVQQQTMLELMGRSLPAQEMDRPEPARPKEVRHRPYAMKSEIIQSVEKFVGECCFVADCEFVACRNLIASYLEWAKSSEDKPLSTKSLGMALTKLGFGSDIQGAQRVRYRTGLGLRRGVN
jgi:hypothetical protein